MYLRTTQRRNTDGTTVRYYQLAENTWDAAKGCAVARVVYNFGRADKLDRTTLQRLAHSILRVVHEQEGQLVSEDGTAIQMFDAWPFGGIWVLDQLWKELGIDSILKRHAGVKRSTLRLLDAVFVMVVNRTLEPVSKLYCWEQWLREEVFLPRGNDLELHHLYLGMDLLEKHKEEIEKSVYFAMADLMNADVDLIFYDTTSLHFEVDEEDEAELGKRERRYPAQRKRGHSKNGRSDAPQIVIGLAVTRDGLPVRSWVFPGNTADVTTVERVKNDLRGWRLGRCVFVGDAGMNSEENRRSLSLGAGKYILAAKMRAGDEVTHEVLTRPGRYHALKENLRVKEVTVGDGERKRRYVVCHNPLEEERQRKHRERLVALLELELGSLQQLEGNPHSKRACELRTSARFGRYLRENESGKLSIDRTAIRNAERYDGKWVVTSNDDTLTSTDLALGYKQLMRVEQCWRQLKSGLRLRPVYHYRPWRIHAHVTITVLGLLLERIIEIRTGDTWRNVLDKLQTIKIVEYERDGVRVRQTTELRPDVQQLLARLKIPMPPKLHDVQSQADSRRSKTMPDRPVDVAEGDGA
jgi:transposase